MVPSRKEGHQTELLIGGVSVSVMRDKDPTFVAVRARTFAVAGGGHVGTFDDLGELVSGVSGFHRVALGSERSGSGVDLGHLCFTNGYLA